MYEFRDRAAAGAGMELIVHCNEEGLAAGVTPLTRSVSDSTDVMKTRIYLRSTTIGFEADQSVAGVTFISPNVEITVGGGASS